MQSYVLSVNGTTMYVDLENPGARTYPGEGEERQTAFDISNAEQIQTEISDVYPASNHLFVPVFLLKSNIIQKMELILQPN